jgi:hypothetical protein
MLSYDADASNDPSGENDTAVTSSVWPWSTSPLAFPVSMSQSLTVQSADADASSDPSGENDTAVNNFVWPWSTPPLAFPVSASQSPTVLSADRCRHQQRPDKKDEFNPSKAVSVAANRNSSLFFGGVILIG